VFVQARERPEGQGLFSRSIQFSPALRIIIGSIIEGSTST
jgi:hypothetical protein